MRGSKVVELVSLFDSFYSTTGSDDLVAFSVWMNRQFFEPPIIGHEENSDIADNRLIVWNIHRLSKFFRWYSKSFLNSNGLSSMDEYFFLVSIQLKGAPSKNEVYKDTISELTTGAQMMKRLIELGMVEEFADQSDKRVKRVKLTEKGKLTRERIFEQSKADLLLKSGNLSPEEKRNLKYYLTYLEKFHHEIYKTDGDKSTDEILNKYLM